MILVIQISIKQKKIVQNFKINISFSSFPAAIGGLNHSVVLPAASNYDRYFPGLFVGSHRSISFFVGKTTANYYAQLLTWTLAKEVV